MSSATTTRSVLPRKLVMSERVPQDMGGRVVVERGLLGDGGDDAASRAGRQASALGVEEQRGTGAGAGPGSAFGQPLLQPGPESGVDGDLADLVALAVDAQDALAGRAAHVADVQAHDFAEAGAGVVGDEGDAPVAGRGDLLDRAQPADAGLLLQCAGCLPGQVVPVDLGRAQAAPQAEVVDRGERGVGVDDAALDGSLVQQPAPVVAYREVAGPG